MSFSDIYLIVPNPVISGLIWFFALSAALYFARLPAQKYILAFSQVIHNAMRLAANSVKTAEQRLQARNREVLLEAGREATERMIEREFERIDATVRKDLADYPALHRQLSEEITAIDDDYAVANGFPLLHDVG